MSYWHLCTVVYIVCAWCNTTMGAKNGQGLTGVSHSICPACTVKWETE